MKLAPVSILIGMALQLQRHGPESVAPREDAEPVCEQCGGRPARECGPHGYICWNCLGGYARAGGEGGER